LLIALVGVPRPSEAGLLEIIWEMSGPTMLGISYGCMIRLPSGSLDQCRVGGNPVAQARTADASHGKGVFLALGASLLGSTGKDSRTQGYDWGEIWMLAAEPGIAFRSFDNADCAIQVHHGIGISWDLMFGKDIPHYDKFAIVVTPVDVAFGKVAFGIKLRLYPNGFTDDEFKPRTLAPANRPFETTLGFTFSIITHKS